MVSEFVREQKRYTEQELCYILHCSETETLPLIRRLKEYGILKAVKTSDLQKNMSDLTDEDIAIADVESDENEYLYVFTFVGVVVIAGRVLKCYPKYLIEDCAPKNELRQVLKVLEKYNSQEQIVRMTNDTNESRSFNLLAIMLYLMHDYYENGVYSTSEEIIESNGSGEIIWDRTINDTFTLISNNRPYYVDLQTKKRVNDEYGYFKRLHECILTSVSKDLEDADLLSLFEITEIDLTDEQLDNFGEKDYVLYRIENELNTQFNTRKQLVLKTMYAYIAQGHGLSDSDCLSLFGTNSFNLVWEKVCAEIMDNQLNTRLGTLKFPVSLRSEYNPNLKLIDLIEKPLWTMTQKRANDTLVPDLISISETAHGYQFIIFDAKYYTPQLEKGVTPKAQPGIESVTKQYLYQLAYKKFITEHGFTTVKNCFLMPTEKESVVDKGEVSMEILNGLGLETIKVRFLPAKKAYDCYLDGNKMDLECLLL
ncbi:MAG: LlaJI family restriction endonuclease [Oscillospiraceae bacterium]|nr:LlaJI family restriction endonuclease [Oscillospiraceae bacterium]